MLNTEFSMDLRVPGEQNGRNLIFKFVHILPHGDPRYNPRIAYQITCSQLHSSVLGLDGWEGGKSSDNQGYRYTW